MKKYLLLIVLILSHNIFSQDSKPKELSLKDSVSAVITVKGTFAPTANYSWVILYRIVGAQQRYIVNTGLKEGKFTIKMPKNAIQGMYRLTYDLNNNGYVDFIYNNKNIALTFDPKNPGNSLKFTTSDENILFKSYLSDITKNQNELDSLQFTYFKSGTKKKAAKSYKTAYKKLQKTQEYYREKASATMAANFIYALQKYNAPKIIDTEQEYMNSTQDHFFDFINFKNPLLLNSTIITKKAVNYVFYLNTSDDDQTQQALYKKSVIDIFDKIQDQPKIQAELLTTLMYGFVQMQNVPLVDYLMDNYYKKLPPTAQDKSVVEDIALQTKTAVGRVAPDFNYNNEKILDHFYTIKAEEHIILVFWSTSCSHCLKEIPLLHEYSLKHKNIKVVAVALEKDDLGFKHYTQGLENFKNILGLQKWKNPIAKLYNITTTPNYFVLDKQKNIIAKPYDIKKLKAYFAGLEKK